MAPEVVKVHPPIVRIARSVTLELAQEEFILAAQARGDRAHIYLADPHGNVMLRWPSNPDLRRMYQDIDRLLKASQIG